jgi:hypothetical protein
MIKSFLYTGDRLKTVTYGSGYATASYEDLETPEPSLGVLSMYNLVPYVYRAVDIRAKAVASVPWHLTDSNGIELSDHPLLHNMRTRLLLTESALCLYGCAYWLFEGDTLRWALPSSITPRYDSRDGLVGFDRSWTQGGGKAQRLAPDELVYFWLPNLSAELGPGVPPANRALAAARVLYHLDRFADQFFQRGAIKATLLSVEGNPPRQELDRLESWWRRLVSGVRNAWRSVAIRSTVKPITIGEGLSELENNALVQQRREDICAAFGVPHSLLSADAANYATSENDRTTFLQQTVKPSCLLIEEVLNGQVFGPLGLRFAFGMEDAGQPGSFNAEAQRCRGAEVRQE